MNTRQQPSTDQADCGQVNEIPYQERIVQFVLDDWMSTPAEREPSRFAPTSFGTNTLPEVTSCTEVRTEHQQQYAGLVGPHDQVFAVRINDGGITATAMVAHLMRDDRLELLQACCDWPPQVQKRELPMGVQFAHREEHSAQH